MKAHFHRLISFTALGMAPLWIPLKLIRYRGHFLDGVSRSLAILLREVPLRFAAQRAGIRLENPFLRFPGIEREPTRLVPGHWTSSHEQIEYPLLMALCALLKPRRIFEFGTFLGEATLMFARAAPEASITTINIPEYEEPTLGIGEKQRPELLRNQQIGSLFQGGPENRRINQILCDSATFDINGHENTYDFIWIDAGHSYENVKSDSKKALAMIRKNGYIFWHDFDAEQPGVTRALLEIASNRKLFWIARTSIVGFQNT